MAKKIGKGDLIGQSGIAVIGQVVRQMGFVFYETGGVEAGIDGYIEVRDATTGAVSNLIIQVQSKATEKPFAAESDTSFEYLCDERDLEYWFYGNAPVIIICVNTIRQEAWWKSIRDWFKDAAALKSRRIVFDKAQDAFTTEARERLLELVSRSAPGSYSPPTRRAEHLLLNLLEITHVAPSFYVAETGHKDDKSFGTALRAKLADAPGEWFVKSGRVFSLMPLDEFPWKSLCDVGTMDELPMWEWSESDDPDRQGDFVRLLNRCVGRKVQDELRYSKDNRCHYFRPSVKRINLAYTYEGPSKTTSRMVVKGYGKRKDGGGVAYIRHSAFKHRFHRLTDKWYMEVEPTYFFTRDGWKPDRFASEHLKKIKELETNDAVLGQFLMWQHFLTVSRQDLLGRTDYPFLSFGRLDPLISEVGLSDELWKQRETPERIDLLNRGEVE